MRQGTYVVTGAGGFVGAAVCRALVAAGCKVKGLARGSYPELAQAGVQMIRVDITQAPEELGKLLSGAEAVFHTAAKVEMWGRYEDFFAVNVQGTRNLLEACRKVGVPRFVFTSSPSVIADDSDLRGIDEQYPYPRAHLAAYPETKAIAEREVCAANEEGKLHTIALRPHLIFGPGDHHLVPTILGRARAGMLMQVGSGKNVSDFTFIEDCTRAHLLAAEALDLNPACRGRIYFITQGEPIPMWDWINQVLSFHDLPPVQRRVPTFLARRFAALSEAVWRLGLTREPRLTRFLVSQMSTDHYFSIAAAGRDLDFHPRYSMAEAMRITFGVKR